MLKHRNRTLSQKLLCTTVFVILKFYTKVNDDTKLSFPLP